MLAIALIDVGRLPEAAATAERLPKTRPADPAAYVHAAALLIKCADAAPSSPGGPRADFLARPSDILREAVRSKVIRSPATLDVPDLRPLRDRDDFKALRESLAQCSAHGLIRRLCHRADPIRRIIETIQVIVTRVTISPDGAHRPILRSSCRFLGGSARSARAAEFAEAEGRVRRIGHIALLGFCLALAGSFVRGIVDGS